MYPNFNRRRVNMVDAEKGFYEPFAYIDKKGHVHIGTDATELVFQSIDAALEHLDDYILSGDLLTKCRKACNTNQRNGYHEAYEMHVDAALIADALIACKGV